MFVECFMPDFGEGLSSVVVDVPYGRPSFYIDIVEIVAQRRCWAPVVPLGDQAERLAEALLSRAASTNEPLYEATIRRRYEDKKDLDVPFGRILIANGVRLAVPDPEYLGLYFTNGLGGANLVLNNARVVIPLK